MFKSNFEFNESYINDYTNILKSYNMSDLYIVTANINDLKVLQGNISNIIPECDS